MLNAELRKVLVKFCKNEDDGGDVFLLGQGDGDRVFMGCFSGFGVMVCKETLEAFREVGKCALKFSDVAYGITMALFGDKGIYLKRSCFIKTKRDLELF